MPAEPSDRQPIQYSIRTMLILTAVAAALFGAARVSEGLRIILLFDGALLAAFVLSLVLNNTLSRTRWCPAFVQGLVGIVAAVIAGLLGVILVCHLVAAGALS